MATLKYGEEGRNWGAAGDPTVIAVQVFVNKAGNGKPRLTWPHGTWPHAETDVAQAPINSHFELIVEHSFDSTIKKVSTLFPTVIRRAPRTMILFSTKGAFERTLDRYLYIGIGESRRAITQEDKDNIIRRGSSRSLVLSFRILKSCPPYRSGDCGALSLVGIHSILENWPFLAILLAQNLKMPTVPVSSLIATAAFIARSVLTEQHGPATCMTVQQLGAIPDAEIDALPELPVVVARCSPETKSQDSRCSLPSWVQDGHEETLDRKGWRLVSVERAADLRFNVWTLCLAFCLFGSCNCPSMTGSLDSFSRQIHNVLRAQQSQILQALDAHSYDIHQKLSGIQRDVESLRNETLSQQNAFRSAFDIVAARLDEIQWVSQTARPTILAPPPNKDTNEDHRIQPDSINNRMELAEKRLGKSMGDVAKTVTAVEQSVAEILKTVKDPHGSFNLTNPDNTQASLAKLEKIIESLSQGSFAPQQPAKRATDSSLPIPAKSDNHGTTSNGTKSPEAVPIVPAPPAQPSNVPPKPSQARESKIPKAPVGDVRRCPRLEKKGGPNIDDLFSGDSPLTDLGSPLVRSVSPSTSPPKKGKELVLHRSSALNKSLGKRKRSSGVPKGRKKGTTTSKTAAKGKEIAQDDQGDQPPVMVMCNKCNGWYHINCVSINEDDPCMAREDLPYTCPPCGYPDRYTVVPREGEYDCGAPGCVIPKQQSSNEVFYIDKLIGRKPINDQNSPAKFAWLVKFDEYPIGACLWKPEDTFDAKALKVEFYAAATKEGISSSAKDHEMLLLREAADYGGTWGDDEA